MLEFLRSQVGQVPVVGSGRVQPEDRPEVTVTMVDMFVRRLPT